MNSPVRKFVEFFPAGAEHRQPAAYPGRNTSDSNYNKASVFMHFYFIWVQTGRMRETQMYFDIYNYRHL